MIKFNISLITDEEHIGRTFVLPDLTRTQILFEIDSELLKLALRRHKNNRTAGAKELGMERTTFVEKLRKRDWLKEYPSSDTKHKKFRKA